MRDFAPVAAARTGPEPGASAPLPQRGRRVEALRLACYGAGAVALLFCGLLAGLLVVQSLPAWRSEGVLGFLLGRRWFPRAGELGALPMLYGTAAVSAVALAVAAPLGLGAAIFTSEVLPPRARLAVKGTVELLAGVPSVVYGLLGILLLRDRVYHLLAPFEPLSGDTLLTAGLLLGVMVLPTVTTFSEDALQGVAGAQRRAARGLGLTRARTLFAVVLPRALPGIAAALLLALGRALGETIAVFLVVGRLDNRLPEAPVSMEALAGAGQTLTSKLASSETFIAYGDPEHWGAVMGLALVLVAAVLAVTLASARVLRKGGRDAAPR